MRAGVRRTLAVMALLGLAACVMPQAGGGKPKAPNPVTGGEIEVTALDAPAPAPAKPNAKAPNADAPVSAPKAPAEADGAPAAAAPAPAGTKPAAADPAAADSAAAGAAPPAEPAPPKSEAQIACEKRGDLWTRLPDSQAQTCVTRTRDAGKSCTTSRMCEGECLARSGTCAPYTPLFGCNEIFQDDGTRMTLCLD